MNNTCANCDGFIGDFYYSGTGAKICNCMKEKCKHQDYCTNCITAEFNKMHNSLYCNCQCHLEQVEEYGVGVVPSSHKKEGWINKLMDLMELECEKCPQRKGECYANEIIELVQGLLKAQKAELKKELLEKMPELGIKWMQEGYKKDRKGFTEGYNQALQEVKDIILKS